MRVSILGPLAVESDGRPIAVGGAVRRRLLAILALQPERTIPADRLIELLWGDDAPTTPQNTLQVHVAALRRALGGDRIRTESGGYRLVARPDEVDAEAFDSAVADARRWAGLDPQRAIRRLDDALARWRGDVLADVAVPTDLVPDVAGLEARREAAIDLRLRLRLAAGDARAVLPELEALVADAPANESWIGLLMVARYRLGRQADALETYREARRHLRDELGLDPSPGLRRLELAILRQDPELETDDALGIVPAVRVGGHAGQPAGARSSGRDALPAELTTFVGRESELARIGALLDGGARLVTIAGIGGAGKSRLALRAARAARTRWPDGAAWVDLRAATIAEHVAEAIATALGVRDQLEPPFVSALPVAVRDRAVLLVLDNCEQATVAIGEVVEPLLATAADLSAIATSREPLGLAAEHLLALEGLALPPADSAADPVAIRSTDAVALLLDRGRAASARREIADDELAEIVDIVRRLDGLPLAIEMAAAGLRAESAAEVAARLANPGATLGLAGSTRDDRHGTLRDAFVSSLERLGPGEVAVFRRLAAFVSAVPAAALVAVCGDGIDDVPAVLSSLVERSLVVPVAAGRVTRYGLLVPVREYAAELLDAAGERERTLARHLAWATELAQAEYDRRIPDEAGAIRAITAHLDEIRAALSRSIGGPGATEVPHLRAAGQELASLLGWFWPNSGRMAEGRPIAERALAGSTGLIRARLLRGLASMVTYAGEPDRAVELLRECLALYREVDEPADHALAYSALGWAYLWPGRNELALDAFERGAEQADRVRDPRLRPTLQAILLGYVAQAIVAMRDIPRARALGERVLREAAPGDLRTLHFGHHFLGDCALLEHDPATAVASYARSLELAMTLDDPVEICVELEGLAMSHAGLGRPQDALRIYEASEAWLDRMGVRIQIPFWNELLKEWIGPARASLGSPGEPDGTPLGAAEVVALARSLPTTAPQPADADQWEK